METLVLMTVVASLGLAVYRYGKQIGSRKGYFAGRRDTRRRP